ncbi:MAG: site-specific DNA-methyltransferase [Clostridiales bacterium]|nr:site-specific DNA-methyltransferase [Clostridiales bacterium]
MANLSQIKREKMLKFLETLKEQHSDDESLIAINQIENELTSKKYGLVWEEHEEEVDVKMRTHIPVFTEVEEKEIVGDSESEQYNFLLEGDNLHSLKLLEKTHKGKIDVIYIDPPYNTGHKDFVYDDAFVDRQDGYAHSKWISFMEKRLRIAQGLLKPAGTIFISIDDNEYANLKLLCDEIFGEENMISDIIWNSRKSVSNDAVVSLNHNYTLVYTRNIYEFNKVKQLFKLDNPGDGFDNPDNDPRGPWKADPFDSPGIRPNLTYGIVNPNTGVEYWPPEGRCWRTGEEEYLKYLTDNRIVFGKTGKSKPQLKRFLSEAQNKGITPKSLWDDCGTATDGTKELQNLFGTKAFDTPKPTGLIKKIINLAGNKNSLILDFFAGSGTTGQAVLDMNSEDGGDRHFILCTNNDGDICRNVTYPRIKTVITGKRADESEYSEGKRANLKYYKTDFVDKESEEIYDELLEHTKEMIQLQYGVKVDNQKYIMIMDDDEMDEFEKHFDEYKDIDVLFINQDVLLSTSQEKLLQNINTKIIPDCYFDFELREVGELW